MDATHLHLALAHFPIIGIIIGAAILAYGQIIKNLEIQKVALWTIIIMALLTIPVFISGEESEEVLENLAGFPKQLIENHEELAEKAIWLMAISGILSLIALYVLNKKFPFSRLLSWIIIITSLATFGVFAQVANLGGQIRHSEIRTEGPNNLEPKGKDKKGSRQYTVNIIDHSRKIK